MEKAVQITDLFSSKDIIQSLLLYMNRDKQIAVKNNFWYGKGKQQSSSLELVIKRTSKKSGKEKIIDKEAEKQRLLRKKQDISLGYHQPKEQLISVYGVEDYSNTLIAITNEYEKTIKQGDLGAVENRILSIWFQGSGTGIVQAKISGEDLIYWRGEIEKTKWLKRIRAKVGFKVNWEDQTRIRFEGYML